MAKRKSSPPLPSPSLLRRFDCWVYSWLPGLKTKILTITSAVGLFAASIQDYISKLPLDQLISAKTLAIITAVVFTLAFWFHGMKDRNT